FNTFLYPQLASSSSKTDAEFETALRVMRVFKDPSMTEVVPLNATEEEQRKGGQKVYAFRRLLEDEATFLLETDEWEFVKARLKEHKVNVALAAIDDFNDLLEALNDAPEFKPDPEEEKVAATELPEE
ncbi:hypothetical protein LCGC14_2510820, partial [marine sediment metagenome]